MVLKGLFIIPVALCSRITWRFTGTGNPLFILVWLWEYRVSSFQPGEEEFSQYAAGELTGSISYMLSQNCELALYSRCLTGGMYGEFSNLSPEQSLVALVLTYQF